MLADKRGDYGALCLSDNLGIRVGLQNFRKPNTIYAPREGIMAHFLGAAICKSTE